MESGSMIRLRARELTLMRMALTIMVTGLTINSMDGAWSLGLMVLNTKVNIEMAKKKAEGS